MSQAPAKLFREEAKTGSVACPACGAPITLKGFGAVERVACAYCGSSLEPQDSGALNVLQQDRRARRPSALPLHARGELDGTQWEVIGIIWREARVDGIAYPWQEFLLFNPWRGFRWLVFSMVDHGWGIGAPLAGAPAVDNSGGHRHVSFDKRRYKHFSSAPAFVTYVEGEFPWQVQAGDQAFAEDFVDPPRALSIEHSRSAEGSDIQFTTLEWIEPKQVWKAFKCPGRPPPLAGVPMLRPNPNVRDTKFYLISMLVLLGLWVAATVTYIGGRDTGTVANISGVAPNTLVSEQVEIGTPGERTTVEVEFRAQPLSNGWAYAEVLLVNTKTEEARTFGLEIDEWHGVDGGESWREGTNPKTLAFGGIEGGTYVLQAQFQVDPKTPTPPQSVDLRVRQDIPLARYVGLPLLCIFLFPGWNFVRRGVYEARRWQNSDYASEE